MAKSERSSSVENGKLWCKTTGKSAQMEKTRVLPQYWYYSVLQNNIQLYKCAPATVDMYNLKMHSSVGDI